MVVEESDNPRSIIKLMSDVLSTSVPIRILIVSRKNPGVVSQRFRSYQRRRTSSLSAAKDIPRITVNLSAESWTFLEVQSFNGVCHEKTLGQRTWKFPLGPSCCANGSINATQKTDVEQATGAATSWHGSSI